MIKLGTPYLSRIVGPAVGLTIHLPQGYSSAQVVIVDSTNRSEYPPVNVIFPAGNITGVKISSSTPVISYIALTQDLGSGTYKGTLSPIAPITPQESVAVMAIQQYTGTLPVKQAYTGALGTYNIPGLADVLGKIKKTETTTENTLSFGIPASVYEIGEVPYTWTAAPVPHWAFIDAQNDVINGGLPEILRDNGYMRIGTVLFQQAIGPINLQIFDDPQIDVMPVLRHGESMKRVAGNIRRMITFEIDFPGQASINEELVPLLRQCRRAPFIPITHSELYDKGIDALAMQSINIQTVEGQPELLRVTIRAYAFFWKRFMIDADDFELCINYPLLELWLNYPGDPNNPTIVYNPQQLTEPVWRGTTNFYTPDEQWLDLVNDNTGNYTPDEVKAQFLSNQKGTQQNLLIDAANAVETGNVSALPVFDSNTDPKTTGAFVVQGNDNNTYIAIHLLTQPLLEAASAPISSNLDSGADYILSGFSTSSSNPSQVNVTNVVSTGQGLVGTTARALLYNSVQENGAAVDTQYWGLWRTNRTASMKAAPINDKGTANSPLGVAAQISFFDPGKPFYTPALVFSDMVVTSIQGGISNKLAEFSPADDNMPTYQFTGSSDISLMIEGVCSEATSARLEDLIKKIAQLSIKYRGQWDGSPYGGYCYFDNEIAQILGMTTAIPTSLIIDTIEGFPLHRSFKMQLLSFDVRQRQINQPMDFGTDNLPGQNFSSSEFNANFGSLAVPYAVIENHIRGIELYPDIRPPTWTLLAQWVKDIQEGNIWDEANNAPYPQYNFLSSWRYTPSYLHSCNTYLIDDKGNTPYKTQFINQTGPNLNITNSKGKVVSQRRGWADPDFYCASRGDVVKPVGRARIETLIDNLQGQSTLPTDPHSTVAWGSDGVKAVYPFGTSSVSLATDPGTVGSIQVHQSLIDSIKPIPQDASPDTSIDHSTTVGYYSKDYIKQTNPQDPSYNPFIASNVAKGLALQGASVAPQSNNYAEYINEASEATGVDARIIETIIYQESKGDPNMTHNNIDGSTDYGLMQLNSRYSGKDPTVRFNPQLNIRTGTEYIAACLEHQGGNLFNTFRAYNGGNNFKNSLKSAQADTLNYAKKAMAYYNSLPTTSTTPQTTSPLSLITEMTPANIGKTVVAGVGEAVHAVGAGAGAAVNAADPPNFGDWTADRAILDTENGEDIYWSLRRAEMSGRLLQAYPTYLILIIGDGNYLRVWRLFDVFYGLHSAMSISTFSSRKNPADECVIRFADPYNSLSATAEDVEVAKASDTRHEYNIPDWWDNQVLAGLMPNDTTARLRKTELASLLVKPGNRIHLRLGYGSDAASLPIVFNGVISGVQHNDDIIEVLGMGDGVELTSQLSPNADGQQYVDISSLGAGAEMRDIILHMFTMSQGDLAEGIDGFIEKAATALTGGYLLGGNPYGISHFGSMSTNFLLHDTAEIGVNVYSGWEEYPVNMTYATENNALIFSLIPQAIELIGQSISKPADAVLNKFTGSKLGDQLDTNRFWRRVNGEQLVGIKMEKATPWDIISTLRYVGLDYIRMVEPFSIRSTLFFGKGYWPLHYRYDYEALDAALSPGGQKSVLSDAEQAFRRRPYMQLHLAHSANNLIASNVEATQDGWCTIVQSIGSVAGILIGDKTETSYSQFIDANIFPEQQRMKIIQSGLYSTQQQRWEQALADGNGGEILTSTNVLNNHAVGVLHDEVREMYRGDITVLGNGYIRPFHMIHLMDYMKDMAGLMEVKEVSHSFTPEGGFYTIVSPDCVASAADTALPSFLSNMLGVAGRLFISNLLNREVSLRCGRWLMSMALGVSIKGLSIFDKIADRTLGSAARGTEYAVSKVLRNQWRKNWVSRTSSKVIDNINGSKAFGSTRREILDQFEAALTRKSFRSVFGYATRRRVPIKTYFEAYKQVYSWAEKEYIKSLNEPLIIQGIATPAGEPLPKLITNLTTDQSSRLETWLDKYLTKYVKGYETKGTQLKIGEGKAANYVDEVPAGTPPYAKEDEILDIVADKIFKNDVFALGGASTKLVDDFTNWAISNPNIYKERITKQVSQALRALGENQAEIAAEIDAALDALKAQDTADIVAALTAIQNNGASLASILEATEGSTEAEKELSEAKSTFTKLREAKLTSLSSSIEGIQSLLNKTPDSKALQRQLASLKKLYQQVDSSTQDANVIENTAKAVAQDDKAAESIKALLSVFGYKGQAVGAGNFANTARRAVGGAVQTGADIGESIEIGKVAAPLLAGFKKIRNALAYVFVGGFVVTTDRQLAARHALFVYPIQSCGHEFSAGINGHAGACPGDTLGMLDSVLAWMFDDTKGNHYATFFTGLLGMGNIHYSADPLQYQDMLRNVGIDPLEHPTDTTQAYKLHLQDLAGLGSQGFNIKAYTAADGQSPPTVASSTLGTGDGTGAGTGGYASLVPKSGGGGLVAAYQNAVARAINGSANLTTYDENGTTLNSYCYRTVKQVLREGGVPASDIPSGQDQGAAKDAPAYFQANPNLWQQVPLTSAANAPEGSIAVWPTESSSGHIGFLHHENGNTYIIGNTSGSTRYQISPSSSFNSPSYLFLPQNGT